MYLLIADTEKYVGSFERELCAWVTGTIGDCGVGKVLASEAREDMSPELFDWVENGGISSQADEHGWRRPVAISLSPGGEEFNSVEIYLSDRPSEQLLHEMIERVRFFCAEHKKGGACAGKMGRFRTDPIPVTGIRLVQREVVTTDTLLFQMRV